MAGCRFTACNTLLVFPGLREEFSKCLGFGQLLLEKDSLCHWDYVEICKGDCQIKVRFSVPNPWAPVVFQMQEFLESERKRSKYTVYYVSAPAEWQAVIKHIDLSSANVWIFTLSGIKAINTLTSAEVTNSIWTYFQFSDFWGFRKTHRGSWK